MTGLPELRITVFSDYICPFCYVGHHRLMRLRDRYDLRINWCFLEIHPETSSDGEPVASLQYPSEQWRRMMDSLKAIAAEENIPVGEHDFTTNSRDALLLSEAAKTQGREPFYRLHEKLFTAFFVDGSNIGDRDVLRKVAAECGIDKATVEASWLDETFKKRLVNNFQQARRHGIQAVPTFVFGERKLTGVVSEGVMREAAEQSASCV